MMMKRKTHEHLDKSHQNNQHSADNKDNTITTDNNISNDPLKTDSDNVHPGGSETDKAFGETKVLEEKLAEMQDRYIRLSAEFDNYRKRTLREKMDLSKYAGEELLLKIIPIMDDFERALQHIDSTADCEAMKSGINLIYSKFSEFLKQNGIKEIEAVNSNFDVDLHEAVAKVAVADAKKGTIIDVVLKGYYLQDKVLRFSKVVVGE